MDGGEAVGHQQTLGTSAVQQTNLVDGKGSAKSKVVHDVLHLVELGLAYCCKD